ncbi:cation:proton antiporter [Haladaptatus sp. DYSN1]|uniref:cation:proton antiporter n=1 Tax=unclassified Haladaptatus TaxID=2622732 RepID=UPI00240525E7|nr:cation:proton antiporter [Haladaptatus sp. DYSN1]
MAMAAVLSSETAIFLLLQIVLLLAVARLLGAFTERIGATRVVGELTTGFVLGPSILGVAAPPAYEALFAVEESASLEVLSLLGLVLLLTLAGIEMEFQLIRRRLRDVVVIGSAGLALPFGLGLGLGLLVPGSLLVSSSPRLVFALFLATALSISAIPVIVRILRDLNVFHQPFGQLTVATAMYTDTLGWVLLSVVVGISRAGSLELGAIGVVLLVLLGFLAVAFTVGQRVVDSVLRQIGTDGKGQLALVVGTAVLGSATTIALGIEPALGAFVAGLLISRSGGVKPAVSDTLERVTVGIFAPLFFGIAGLRADLGALADPTVALFGFVTLAVATVGKLAGVYLGATALGYSRTEALGMGAGLNARGAIEIVIATVGLELGILSVEVYTIILSVAILTSAMTAPLLRMVGPQLTRELA